MPDDSKQAAPGPLSLADLSDQTRLGRLASRLENDPLHAAALLDRLPAEAKHRRAQRIGFTGSPGVGKSTLLAQLIKSWQGEGRRCGVVAVDPSSPFSGGAIMADRLRWVELAGPGVFVRSLASRGSLGGVSAGAGAVARLIEAAGYDPLLIETVGIGQTGFDILALADTVVVLFSPESGDSLQMLKAGMLEAGDIIVVNKSDRPGSETMLQEIHNALDWPGAQPVDSDPGWHVPVLPISAAEGRGITELKAAISGHAAWLGSLGPEHPRRLRRIRGELVYTLRSQFSMRLESALGSRLEASSVAVLKGEMEIWEAVSDLAAQASSAMAQP